MKSIKNITFILTALAVMQGCKRDDSLSSGPGGNLSAKGLPVGISAAAPGTVYFSQDFNSSTDYNDYIGNGIGSSTSLFDNMKTNNDEYASINTLNNTLQIVKAGSGITGVHRASVSRNTTIAGGPAGFLKYEMEITVSNNTENIDNGFQFTVGDIPSDAPAAPAKNSIHSILIVNPSKNTGEFTLQTGLDDVIIQDSAPLTGTQTIVWYINNTGAPVGYTAPDGLPGSVGNDAADIWVVDADGNAKAAIEEAPAITPGKPLRSFKIANNPNFTATLDIDNIVLSEEPSIAVPSIVNVTPPSAVDVPQKTTFDLLPLPGKIEVTYEDGTKGTADVRWAPGPDGYNQYKLGQYTAVGTILPERGTINPDPANQTVETAITLREDMKIINAFTPNNDGINDTWIIPELKLYRTISVEVFDRDGVRLFHTTDPEEGWDGKNQHGQIIAGSYSYIIRVPDLVMVKKGTLTIIK